MGNNFDHLNGSPVVYKRQKWLNVRQFKDELGFLETSVVAPHSVAIVFWTYTDRNNFEDSY